METIAEPIPSLALVEEYTTASLGNIARTRRLAWIVEKMCPHPSQSFARAGGDAAGTEAIYRFLRNPHFGYQDMLMPHRIKTGQRASEAGAVLVIHDTTECAFGGTRSELGRLTGEKDGFLAHASLAIARDSMRPLGLTNLLCWARTEPPRPKASAEGRKLSGADYAKLDEQEKESSRWFEAVVATSEVIESQQSIVHVMDREGDSYALLAKMVQGGHRFIVRMKHDRSAGAEVVVGDTDRVRDLIQIAPLKATREVVLSRREPLSAPRAQANHGPRDSRTAKLEIRAIRVQLECPRYLRSQFDNWLSVQLVHVTEVDVPPGAEPVDWLLVTTEPIDSTQDVLAIVDGYRARWLIEEYFKALKTGCGLEKRELESFETLTKGLAILAPMAWQMLLLRNLARNEPNTPATEVLTPTQIEILRVFRPKAKLSERPTAREAMLAVASLGGHLKNNGDPGWLVIGRGLEELLTLEQGWTAALVAASTRGKT